MTKEIEVIPEVDTLPILTNEGLLQLAERAEKQVEAIKKIKGIVLKVTNPQDWVDQNGKPYLQASGGEKVARVFGISWTIGEPTFEVEPDGHYQYTYKGVFSLGGVAIEAIGTRSSKDGFFKKYGPKDSDGERVVLPPSEIDKGDVKKSAYTNCIGNGVTRLLGIRNLTWEEVQSGGIERSKTGKVEYRKESDGAVSSDQTLKRQEHNRRIKEALIRLYGNDKKAMADKVIELTTWTPTKGPNKDIEQKGHANYESIKSDQSVAILCSKLEKLSPLPKPEQQPEEVTCSECRKSITKGACTCPEQQPPDTLDDTEVPFE